MLDLTRVVLRELFAPIDVDSFAFAKHPNKDSSVRSHDLNRVKHDGYHYCCHCVFVVITHCRLFGLAVMRDDLTGNEKSKEIRHGRNKQSINMIRKTNSSD